MQTPRFWLRVTALFGLLAVGRLTSIVRAADDVHPVAEFTDARKGRLTVSWEAHPDGGRAGNLRIASNGLYGATMYLHEKEIAALRVAVVAAKPTQPNGGGKSTRIQIPDRSGSLWIEAVYPNKEILMRWVRVESDGGSYPPIVFDLAAADFDTLVQALDEVAHQLDLAKWKSK